jgi:hypothetical protein
VPFDHSSFQGDMWTTVNFEALKFTFGRKQRKVIIAFGY